MRSRSFALRLFAAFAGLALFYGISTSVALLCIAVPAAFVLLPRYYGHETTVFPIWIAVPFIATAVAIVRGLWPVPNAEPAPGVDLRLAEHPELLGLLRDVARRMGTELPPAVRVVPGFNAAISY